MIVLEKGREQNGWAKEFNCTGDGGCGAKLLVEEDDVMIIGERGGSYCESGQNVYGFQCPECNVKTEIGLRGSIPYELEIKLRK